MHKASFIVRKEKEGKHTNEPTVHKASFIVRNATMKAGLNEASAGVTRRAFVKKPFLTSALT